MDEVLQLLDHQSKTQNAVHDPNSNVTNNLDTEGSSTSSNEFKAYNQNSTGSQFSSVSKQPILDDFQLGDPHVRSEVNNYSTTKCSESQKVAKETFQSKKNSQSMIQRSVSTISNKLLTSTLPRLSSSNSLREQFLANPKSSVARQDVVKTDDPYGEVAKGLESCYKKVLLPFEERCNFHQFHHAKYDDCEFESKPFVLLIGQYSTGKSSLIRYMAGEDYPGINIGPEPTTDRFTVILHGKEKKVISGNSLVMHKQLPFRALQKFGNAFLSRLQCSIVDSNMLNGLALVDTPGILSGQKQFGKERGYDFPAVLEWFAERVDRILVLFDAHKLDISDEFKKVLDVMKHYEEKVRIVLNKSDMLEPQQLFRVYGSLMWSLGKSITCPEAVRVYVGSFWDQPYLYEEWKQLFENEQSELFQDLKSLPQMSASRKINDFSKRIKMAKAHALVLAEIQRQMPNISFFKEKKKQKIIASLDVIYSKVRTEFDLSNGDFPDIKIMKEKLGFLDWNKFRDVRKRDVEKLDKLLSHDLANLISFIPTLGDLRHGGEFPDNPQRKKSLGYKTKGRRALYANGINKERKLTAFEYGELEFEIPHRKLGHFQLEEIGYSKKDDLYSNWQVYTSNRDRFQEWRESFESLKPIDGKISKEIGKEEIQRFDVNSQTFEMLWTLADVDKDQMMTANEFCLAMYLIDFHVRRDIELPSELPAYLSPPELFAKMTM